MNRERYNQFTNIAASQKDKYNFSDYQADSAYTLGKPRDIWTMLSNPPYIAFGGVASNNTNPLLIDISSVTAFTSDFTEVNVSSVVGFPLFDQTPGVVNYLTAQYQLLENFGSNRTTFKDVTINYNSRVLDGGRFQWKLSAPIQPEQTGTVLGPFDIIEKVNDHITFSTDQSNPEYIVVLNHNVASVTGNPLASGSVVLTNPTNTAFNFTVDNFSYNLTLSTSGETLTLSGIATRINSLAMTQNVLLLQNIAFQIEGENRLRITSPRDATPIAQKHVTIDGGNALSTLGFTAGMTSQETAKRSAQDIANDINVVSVPEVTAFNSAGHLKIQAQNPIGFVNLQTVTQSVYSTVGLVAPLTTFGAQQIDFNNDIILASATVVSGSAVLSTLERTHVLKIIDNHTGWEEQQTASVPLFISSGIPDDITFTLSNSYIVGANELEVFTNQARNYRTKGYDEIGTVGSRSQQVIVYSLDDGAQMLFRVPNSSPTNIPQNRILKNSSLITLGATAWNFGAEFAVTDQGNGESLIQIGTSGLSGTIMNHGFMHEFGGVQEINVTNLAGLLRQPQKTFIYINDVLLYAPTAFNFSGTGVTITPSGISGAININIPNNIFVDEAGDAIVRLGFQGGTVYPSIDILDDAAGTWTVTVDNTGHLTTTMVSSGSPVSIVLQGGSGGPLYQLGIERVLGSGNLTTQLVTSGTPFVFSLQSPNGKGWGVRVDASGELFTLDPDNVFEIRNSDGFRIFRIDEQGVIYPNQFNYGAVSGNLDYLPSPDTRSGGIAMFAQSGFLDLFISDGSQWESLFVAKKAVFTQGLPLPTWFFSHNLGTADYVVTVKDLSGNVLIPNSINTASTTITVTFTLPQTGKVVIVG